jgi:hypothetical protein
VANIRQYDNELNIKPSLAQAEGAAQTAAGEARLGDSLGQSIGGAIAQAGRPAQKAYDRFVLRRSGFATTSRARPLRT